MTRKVPIGRREGLKLEFKSVGSLDRPLSIAREVVAMLNAEGGKVWIGLSETDGIATREENVPDAGKQKDRLWNVFLEKIDPEPREDVLIEVVSGSGGVSLLCIDVRRDEKRGPYALRGESLLFLRRVDHRVRAMTREEILGKEPSTLDEATRALGLRRDAILALPDDRFWLAFQPSPPGALDASALKVRVRDLLSDPTRAGNRRSGWNYGLPSSRDLRLEGNAAAGTRVAREDVDGGKVAIAGDGCVEFEIPLSFLENDQKLDRRETRELHPLALLEYVVSATRLVRALREPLEELGLQNVSFLVDFAITRAKGWTIPEYAPGTHGYRLPKTWPPHELGEVLQPRARLQFPVEQLASNPDRVGFRVVKEIYEILGLTDDRIPAAYDRAREFLTLTD